ncbi:MAG: hypothetical protein PW845_25020 [Pseudomonas sp.]|uniref:hypothetical protein n=1 Tax=Pseudomonas abieticivorans TaxID=2931382 RepID=UPI0020C111CA|nr:hypothetical protein [Pseudomonas sp. PIA16]MDE1168550.1 hypothetical protein [Pseudomonas sp.]
MSSFEAFPAARNDAWARHAPTTQVYFQLVAEAEADCLCRVLNLFALQGLMPQQVNALQKDDALHIDIQIEGLSWHRAEVIGQKMRNLISVCSVELMQANPRTAWQAAV